MADQRDVQQLIQSLVPASGNAGNPNTAYNNPTPDTWLQGWNGPQVSPAATLGPTNLGAQTVTIPALTLPPQLGNTWNQPIPSLPGIRLPSFSTGGQPGGSWGVTNPNVNPTNPVIPPSVQPGTGPVDTPVDTGIPVDWNALLGGSETRTVENNALAGAILGQPSGNGSYPTGGQLWNPYNLGTTVGVGDGGDFLQFIDMITEPLLSGDFYKSGTGEWDFKGAGLDALAGMAGVPAGAIDQLLGLSTGGLDKIIDKADSGQPLNMLEQLVLDRWRAGADNEIALTQQDINKKLDNNVKSEAERIAEAVNQAAMGSNMNTAAPMRSSQAAGATTIAEGAAAEAMLEGMKTNWTDPRAYNSMLNPDGSPSFLRYFQKER